MVISPVRIESAADLALVTHKIALQLRHVLFGGRFFRERPRQFASNTASVSWIMPASVAAIHQFTGCRTHDWISLMVRPVLLVPCPIEGFGDDSELDDQIGG